MKMEKKAVSGLMLTLLLIGMSVLAFNIQQVKASAAVSPYIAVVPESTVDPALTPGMNYTISIYTDYNGSDVWGYEFLLTFNPYVLEGIEVVNGDLITEDVGTTMWFPGTFNNTAGTLSLTGNAFFAMPGEVPVTCGPGIMANVTFSVVGYGDSYLSLGDETRLIGYNVTTQEVYDIINKDLPYPGHILDGYFANQLEVTHDIAVVSVTPSTTEVEEGELLNVTVVVENQGTVDEDVTVEVYRDYEPGLTFWLIGKRSVNLAAGATKSLVFVWDTTDVSLGEHSLTAVAIELPGEDDVADNMLESDEVVEVMYACIYIRADGSIEGTTDISTTDNIAYTFTDNIFNQSIVVERDNITIDGAGYTIKGTGAFGSIGIDLTYRSNVTIKNLGIESFRYGIWLNMSSSNSISGNNVTNKYYGIYLWDSSNNNTISENTVTNNYYGIGLGGSSNNTVSGNNIANEHCGIRLEASSNYNTISGNNITGNYLGIYLWWSSNYNNVYRNNITNNDYGTYLYASLHNTISGNSIINNNNGIYLDCSSNSSISGNNIRNNGYGVWLDYSSNNRIYHNNFINNTIQVSSNPSISFWDDGYPYGGNYWSDYIAITNDAYSGPFQDETGSDGIGDTAYTIDANNTDNYPLMGMFSDFNATSEYHVTTICNSSISDFQFNGTAICFNVTGESDTTGFCRICIPRALMNETYQVFVNGTEAQCNLLPCSNTTHSYLYFTYNHSTQEVIIIPEFPSFLVLPLFMIATLLAVIVYRRKHPMQH